MQGGFSGGRLTLFSGSRSIASKLFRNIGSIALWEDQERWWLFAD
ncbi:MAG: hypothetical protein Q8P56_06100 [Candidatus Uhrbacteria bacterium]|nr:hypothetical protein [Candidatus Uhrbacteria bacterium]